jgi:ribosome-associated protein
MNDVHEIHTSDGRDFIELCDLLKHVGLADSGGAAKQAIAAGGVTVDGVVETRKRCKVRPGQVVEFEGRTVTVARAAADAPPDGPPAG